MAPETTIPLKSSGPNVVEQQYVSAMDYDDEDDGAIEIDLRCCCKGVLLFICSVSFVLSVFACGAAFATNDTVIPSRLIEAQRNSNNRHTVQESASHTQYLHGSEPSRISTANEASKRSTSNLTSTLATPATAVAKPAQQRAPIEYVQLSFQPASMQSGAIGTFEQCVKLVLQSTAANALTILETLIETNSVLLRPDQTQSISAGDMLIEMLNDQNTVQKIQACAQVRLLGDAMFVYR